MLLLYNLEKLRYRYKDIDIKILIIERYRKGLVYA